MPFSAEVFLCVADVAENGITEPQQHIRRKKTLNVIYTIYLCIEIPLL
jgi:hypothetical protein